MQRMIRFRKLNKSNSLIGFKNSGTGCRSYRLNPFLVRVRVMDLFSHGFRILGAMLKSMVRYEKPYC